MAASDHGVPQLCWVRGQGSAAPRAACFMAGEPRAMKALAKQLKAHSWMLHSD